MIILFNPETSSCTTSRETTRSYAC